MLRNVFIISDFKCRIDNITAVTLRMLGWLGGGYGVGSLPIRLEFESQVNPIDFRYYSYIAFEGTTYSR